MENEYRISHEQFLINLQLEYLTHRLRSLIYRTASYAQVAADIASKKRSKIEDLGKKFGIRTIFSPGFDVLGFVNLYFWSGRGLPHFQYKGEKQRRVQGNYDKWYILFRGTRVKYKGRRTEVVSNNPVREEVIVKTLSGNQLAKYSELTIKKDFEWI